MSRERVAVAVFIVGSVLCGSWAVYNLWPLKGLFGFDDFGGGAIFGLSTTVDALKYIVAPLIAFAISRRLRHAGALARRLRRAHLAASVGIVALLVALAAATASGAFAYGIDGVWFALLIATFAGGALWLPLQAFFTAGFVSLLIAQRKTAR